jgi:hypothetical protein
MSVLSTIVVDVEKFFKNTATDAEKFAVAFWKLFKKSPSALQSVENFLTRVSPEIVAVVAVVDSAAEPEVAAALATAETAVAAVQAAATAATTGTSLLSNLEALEADIPTLLTGLDIKDTTLKATITKIATLIASEAKVLIPAVESWVAQLKSSSTATTTAA